MLNIINVVWLQQFFSLSWKVHIANARGSDSNFATTKSREMPDAPITPIFATRGSLHLQPPCYATEDMHLNFQIIYIHTSLFAQS